MKLKLCQYCKDYYDLSHFDTKIKENGKISYTCKLKPQKDTKKYCIHCKDRFDIGHFDVKINKSGNIFYRCKEKDKKRTHPCKSHGQKRFPLDHFILLEMKDGSKKYACKEMYEKNGNSIVGHSKGWKYKNKRKRTTNLEYDVYSYEWQKNSYLKRMFGIDLNDYNNLLFEQNGVCAICKLPEKGKRRLTEPKALAVDHCHVTGKIRGLLCSECNKGIGLFNDNIELLYTALLYLKNEKIFTSSIEKGQYVASSKEYFKNWGLIRNFGISLVDYNKLFEDQNGCCGICNKHQSIIKNTLNVDHNHNTGNVRSLLCSSCNTGIGQLKDNINIIKSAINYLNRYK